MTRIKQENRVSNLVGSGKALKHGRQEVIINDKIVRRGGTYKTHYPKDLIKFYAEAKPYKEFLNKVSGKIEKVANDYPTITKFRIANQIPPSTWENWVQNYPEMAEAVELVKDMRVEFLTQNGLNGSYNAQMAKFIGMNDLGMSEKKEVSTNGVVINKEQRMKMMKEVLEDLANANAIEVQAQVLEIIEPDEDNGGGTEGVGGGTVS